MSCDKKERTNPVFFPFQKELPLERDLKRDQKRDQEIYAKPNDLKLNGRKQTVNDQLEPFEPSLTIIQKLNLHFTHTFYLQYFTTELQAAYRRRHCLPNLKSNSKVNFYSQIF